MHEIGRLYREHLSPDLARLMKFGGPGSLEETASGTVVTDHLGRDYLDFAGGYGVFSLGHRHPEVVAAVKDQLDRMPLSSRVLLNRPQARLAARLAELAPGDLRYAFFTNSGTEAIEGALKLARLATGRPGFVAAENSFHGKTLGSLSITGRKAYREPFEPLIPGAGFVPFGDLEALRNAVNDTTAAVILEPVQGEGGIHVAPEGYLQQAQALCQERGALLIADEVQCGLGRTGKMFAVEHWGVTPDILVLAKALGGGVMPIGAFLSTPKLWSAYKGRPLLHTSTFGGNPMACAAALATLEVLTRDRLADRAAAAGARLKNEIPRDPELIAEVRGLGLMIGIEMREEGHAGSLIAELTKARILSVYTLNQPRVIRWEPPLTVSEAEMELALAALRQALQSTRVRFRIA